MAQKETTLQARQPAEIHLGGYANNVRRALRELEKSRFAARLWSKDPGLWKTEAPHQKIIRNSLGWLDAPRFMAERLDEIEELAESVARDGFTDVVLLGMGGSSLAA